MPTDQDHILNAACPCGSGRPLRDCHSTSGGAQEQVGAPGITPSPVTRKLDLACGQSPREGFEGVDLWPGAQHVVNLQKFPWPFEDGSVHEIHCSHYIEHIPAQVLSIDDVARHPQSAAVVDTYLGMDALFAFFTECYRILADDGTMTLIWPSHRSDRAFMDPTHRRYIPDSMLCYLTEQWRRDTRLDHYKVECNFLSECNPTIATELSLRHPQVQINHIKNLWNTTVDWVAKLKKVPRLARPG